MITNLFFLLLENILNTLGQVFPPVTLANIWYIGPYLREIFIDVVLMWNTFLETLPYVEIVWNLFLFVVIPLEVTLLVVKLIFGSRTPHNNI